MLLGLDLGTGSAKAILMTLEGVINGEGSSRYAVNAPRPGWADSDPHDWWEAAAAVVRQAVGGRSAEVTALGLSGQMHGVVLCDARGKPLRPAVLWADGRSTAELAAYRALTPEQRLALANPPATGMAGPTLLWLSRHEPEVYHAARWALQPKDWLRLRLTGVACAEPADASATLLYDLGGDTWAVAITEALGLRSELLAPLVPSGTVAGTLTAEAAAHLGLPEGLPVAAGAGDAAAAALGSGLLNPDQVQLTVGTGAQILAMRDQPVADSRLVTHLYRAAQPARWYTMAAMQNAGLALEWVRGVLGLSWPEMYQALATVPPGCEGLTFLPYLSGERTPHLNPEARGAWLGLHLHHTRAHLARAALEGVAFSVRDGLAALEATGIKAPALLLAGGGTLEATWRQLLADVLGRPLAALSVPSASARGAALLAGIASGCYPDAEATLAIAPSATRCAEPQPEDRLEDAWERYRSAYPRLLLAEA
ncbi:MAG: xylulokinase [Truepera sp.]|nr:xylulokinase [Truepera sp.]